MGDGFGGKFKSHRVYDDDDDRKGLGDLAIVGAPDPQDQEGRLLRQVKQLRRTIKFVMGTTILFYEWERGRGTTT